MVKDNFREWLIRKKAYSPRPARDMFSRCKRVERIFNISLDKSIKTEKNLDELLHRLKNDADSYLKAGVNHITSVGILRTAVRLYHEYLNNGN